MLKLSEQYGKWQYLESLFQIFPSEAPFLNHLAKPMVAMVENKSKEKERKKKKKNNRKTLAQTQLISCLYCMSIVV